MQSKPKQYTSPGSYFEVSVLGSNRYQSIPVSFYRYGKKKDGDAKQKPYQVLVTTLEPIRAQVKWASKSNPHRLFIPLIQGFNETYKHHRVTKQGKPLKSSLVFLDADSHVSDQALNTLRVLFEDTSEGVVFRTQKEGRAKIAFVVEGTPDTKTLERFIYAIYKHYNLLGMGIGFPDTTVGGLLTAFIYSEADLSHLYTLLPRTKVWSSRKVQAIADTWDGKDLEWIKNTQVVGIGEAISITPSIVVAEGVVGDGVPQGNISITPSIVVDGSLSNSGILEDSVFESWGAEATVEPEKVGRMAVGLPRWRDLSGEVPAWLFDEAVMGDQALKQDTCEAKLVRWLLSSAKSLRSGDLAIPQREVAEYLGAAQSTLNVLLKRFLDRGWLSRVSQCLRVTDETDLSKLDELPVPPRLVVGEGGEVLGVEFDYLAPKYVAAISKAMGYQVKSMAYTYVVPEGTFLDRACVEVLASTGSVKTFEEVVERLGPPENKEIPDGSWQDELWNLMLTGSFQNEDVWKSYCFSIPGIYEPANTPRVDKVEAIWQWTVKHWNRK